MIDRIEKSVQDSLIVSKAEQIKNYQKWMREIPEMKFPADWNITMIPPFAGAVVRFRVTRDDFPAQSVSVYLDCDDSLGCVGQPYWEIYPYKDDVCRYFLHEIDELLKGIDLAFGNRRRILTKS